MHNVGRLFTAPNESSNVAGIRIRNRNVWGKAHMGMPYKIKEVQDPAKVQTTTKFQKLK